MNPALGGDRLASDEAPVGQLPCPSPNPLLALLARLSLGAGPRCNGPGEGKGDGSHSLDQADSSLVVRLVPSLGRWPKRWSFLRGAYSRAYAGAVASDPTDQNTCAAVMRTLPGHISLRPTSELRLSWQMRIGVVSALLTCAACAGIDDTPPALPNIVVILADDMGYGDVGVYNAESRIPTPHMDQLAAEGVRFTDMHSADSVCTPSRYGLLTGRYCWRTQLQRAVLFNYEPPLIEPDRLTLASLLKRKGYRTGMFGKWHLGLGFAVKDGLSVDFAQPLPWYAGPDPDPAVGASIDFSLPATGGPTALGFDEAFYTAGCATDQEPFCFIHNGEFVDMEHASYRQPAGSWRSGMAAEGWVNETVDVRFTQAATGFIERAHGTSPDRPFFAYLALSAPHSPHLVPDFAAERSEAGVRGDMVWLADWAVGQVVSALDRHALAENTLLIVTSDNGPLRGSLAPGARESTATISNGHRSAGDLRGFKGRIFEGGHRVPFIARWPDRIPPGTLSAQPASLVDLVATVAAIIEEELPNHVAEDSFNMLAALDGTAGTEPIRTAMVHHSGTGSFALRDGPWKIVFGRGEERPRSAQGLGYLFDLQSDIRETTNLWDEQPAVVERLTALMDDYRESGRSVAER